MGSVRGVTGLYERHAHLIDFLKEKTKNAKAPMSICQLSKDYVNETGVTALLDTLNHRIYNFRNKIATLVNYDINTRVRMVFALSGPIDMKFYKQLCKNAIVEVDDKMRITKYVGKDKVLKLSGQHTRKGYASRRQRKVGGRDVESEESDPEEKEKEEEEDVKTTSGRVVKKPRLYLEQLAESYSVLTEKRKNRENEDKREYTLYNDTGDSYTASLAKDPPEVVDEASDLVVKDEILDEDEIVTVDTPEQAQPTQTASTSQVIAPEPPVRATTIDVNQILYPLRNVIEILDAPSLSGLKLLLTNKIADCERNVQIVESNRILESFEAILRIIAKHASCTILSDNTTRFKELLFIFRLATDHFEAPEFVPFKRWLNVACDDVRWLNTKVSYDHIRDGIEYGLHHLYS